jgi:hypothetical protein
MAYTNNKSNGAQGKGGSPLMGMIILGLAYFAITHPAMLGIKALANASNPAHAQEITEQAKVNKIEQENQGGVLHHAYRQAKDASVKTVANPLSGTGAAAIHHVASNVTGAKLNDQTVVYGSKGDDAKNLVRPTCSTTDYYAAAPLLAPEE